MPSRVDEIMDRRSLRRKLTFWRVMTLLVIAAAIAGVAQYAVTDTRGDHIARVRVEGTITEDEKLLEMLDQIRKDDRVKGVILTVDSPGGTTVGGEAIFNSVRKLTESKPVVAQVGTLAASAGYMIASAADHIVARHTSIVGSIGVIVQVPNVAGLMEKIGVGVTEIKSSPLKAEPSPFSPATEEARQMVQNMVRDSYEWFMDLVASRRPLTKEEVRRLSDGSIFTGRQALERKLVDALGGVEEAKAHLVEKGVAEELEIVEWEPKQSDGPWLLSETAAFWMGGMRGFDINAALKEIGAERLFLDGLLSLWQPENGLAGD
ncbi:signal peptide peptidase SppA [Chelativorans composti]|jgi:signal peptide peptidase SppA, 36K type|uniref:Signal peptide peptidase SppA n=1 Tax=Chelativorans composti TaxID=768533 RepID=A0ABW5DFK8_9HYPH|nr:signal peptide peptidase SppA [bacterium SGD-2]